MATILVVENHAMSRQVLNTLLRHMGHRVLEAADGKEGLDICKDKRLDLIISDIALSAMDGTEFVRLLRKEAVHKETPVIFYTARCRHPEDICLDESLGNCCVLPKPSEPQIILQMVNRLLGIDGESGYIWLCADTDGKHCSQSEDLMGTKLRLSVLMDLGYSMVAERDYKRLLNTFCRAMREMLGCQQSLLAIQDKTGIIRYYTGRACHQPVYTCPEHLLPGEIVLDEVADQLKPIKWGQPSGTRMAIPFASPTRYYGWVSILDKSENTPFTREDEEIAVTLSTQAALAYENILLVDHLKKSNETKGMFITNISHELRTPLNILMSNAQLFKFYLQNEEELDRTKLQKKIDMQIRNCNRLLRLVNNFIDINKIESNFFELKPVVCNIVEIVEAITMSVVEYAAVRGIDLVFDTQQEEMILACDLDAVERIILNLLSNAIKFTPRGGTIYVNLKIHKDCVQIIVKDTGIGISKDKLQVIFERFRQADNLMTRKNEGSGIGLTLVKLLTEMHGGRVWVDSEYGEGSEFVVEFPVNLNGRAGCKAEHTVNSSDEDIIQRIQLEFSDIYF